MFGRRAGRQAVVDEHGECAVHTPGKSIQRERTIQRTA